METFFFYFAIGVRKKTEKPIKLKKQKKITEKTELKKKSIKPIKFLKKLAGSVQFRFYKQKTEKTEPNRNRQKTGKKPSQTGKTEPKPEKTEPNRFEPVFTLKNRTETGRFDPVSVFFFKKKNSVWLFFFDKNRPNRK